MKPYAKHYSTLNSGTVGESFIRGMRNAMHSQFRRARGYSVGATAAKMSDDELALLLKRIEVEKPRIEEKQTAKGLEWLRDRRNKKYFSDSDRAIVANFSHFTLEGFEDIGDRGAFYVPIYRVHALDGSSFSYHAVAWQSGGGVEVRR